MGDFDNVATSQDKIGGKIIIEHENKDLQDMMNNIEMSEMDSSGDHFTRSNKHSISTIYFRIDRVLGNKDWFLANLDTNLHILPPNVCDHAILYLTGTIRLKELP